MELPFFKVGDQDISRLVEAITTNKSDDTLGRFMPSAAWQVLSQYLTLEKVEKGHVAMRSSACTTRAAAAT